MMHQKYELKEIKAAIDRAEKDKATYVTLSEEVNSHKLVVSYVDLTDRVVTISLPPKDSDLFAEITVKERFSLK